MSDEQKPTIPDVVADFEAYYAKEPVWGSLHIVLDDGNVEDSSVQFCIQAARDRGDTDGERLGEILLRMSRTQRLRLPHAVHERARARSEALLPPEGQT